MDSRIRVLISISGGADRRKIRQILKTEGFVYRQVQSMKQIRQYTRFWQPDLILLEGNLRYGEEVSGLKHLRSDGRVPLLAFLIEKKEEAHINELYNCGVDGYFLKPIHRPLFESKLRALLRLKIQGKSVRRTFSILRSIRTFLP